MFDYFIGARVLLRRRMICVRYPQSCGVVRFVRMTFQAVMAAGVLLVFAGCTTLDDRIEVAQTAALVTRATGVAPEWLQADAEVASERVDALLADGLTMIEAAQIALLNNPRARAALLDVGVSRADFVQSTLFTNPTLTLSLRFPDGGGLANIETAMSQSIAELWLIPARRDVAQRNLEQTILRSAQTLASISFDARAAFIRAVRRAKQAEVSRDTLTITERLYD
ncbi:MAG: TolC family protein, partial [Phycisphaerae bacterium]